ncbi:MAG: antitoxin [Bifidobacteriaceae bacterium]|jgi:plasmid stability protein|nr:antitoxin [Bifidobacteriaceae bacterium]
MATLTVRNLPDATHRALKAKARAAHRSMEEEARVILQNGVFPPDQVGLGTLLSRIGAEAGGFDLGDVRDNQVSEPIDFG